MSADRNAPGTPDVTDTPEVSETTEASGTPGGSGAPSGSGTPGGSGAPSGSGAPDVTGAPSGSRTPGISGTPSGFRTPGVSGTAGAPGVAEVAEGSEDVMVRDPVSAPDAEGRPRRTTRRFPLFTRDTARPEGGGRAAPGDAPAPARQWPILAVLLTVGLGLMVTALDQFRLGTLLVGVALVAGALLRWLVPNVGMLAVRSRFTDIVTYGGLGLGIVMLALMVQPEPKLKIPFLTDLLHFTISG